MPASYNLQLSYPFDWTGLEDFSSYNYDHAGLPRVNYGAPIGLRYNPITIAQFGLFHLQQFDRTGCENHKQSALTCCRWLQKNGRVRPDGAMVWIYDFDLTFYGPKAPWISGMAQGEALSLLLRCAPWDSQNEFIAMAQQAIHVFDLSVQEQGVLDYLSTGNVFFEEYPTRPASHVLNGHIFALLGLYDYACWSGLVQDRVPVEQGLTTLRNHWQDWDAGYWTRYDLHPSKRLASRMYQKVHVRQMRLLAQLFHEPLYEQVAERWQKMLDNPWCSTRRLLTKIKEKVSR